jgi:15-cis-phytoene synthase
MSLSLIDSYKECRDLFSKHSKSYYLGSMIFPFEKFKLITAFYGLVRLIDDTVDLESELNKKDVLYSLKRDFFYLFDIKNRTNIDWGLYPKIYEAVFDMINELNLSKEIFNRFFQSMEMDLEKTEYNNFDELVTYMDGSAMVVGEVMIQIMSHHSKFYKNKNLTLYTPHARTLGLSFQLTNFIRDISEDMNMTPSRIYLPKNEQKIFDLELKYYTNNNLIDDKFIKFIKFQIIKNRLYYQHSLLGIDELDPNSSKAIHISKILYSNILNEIEEKDYKLLDKKIKVSIWKKLYLILTNLGIINFIIVIKNYIMYTFFIETFF